MRCCEAQNGMVKTNGATGINHRFKLATALLRSFCLAIASFCGVTQTWTVGLGFKLYDVVSFSSGFNCGKVFTLSDTRTCHQTMREWAPQDLMSAFHAISQRCANYLTHVHCYAAGGITARDSYHDRNCGFANVNEGGNDGVNQGSSGMQQWLHRKRPQAIQEKR